MRKVNALAKLKGKYKGPKVSFSSEQVETMKARVQAGKKKTDVAKVFNISREILYQYLRMN